MTHDHSLRVYDSILELLASEQNPTPLVRLGRVVRFESTTVYAKLEWYNPFGAVKDRIAASLVQDAEQRRALRPGNRLVEPTSGNTGLGLAMVGNAKGYPLRAPLSSAIPLEKRTALRFFGCDVVELDDTLCPAPGAPEGAIAMAMSIAENEPGFHMLNQYANDANPQAHYRTTGPEVWRQTREGITHFVAGLGTCGTITGAGRFLKERNPGIRLIGVHPEEGHDIPGVRSLRQLEQTRFFRPELYDAVVQVSNREAYEMCLRLNREESIIAGPSSGMALAGALKDEPGAVAVVIFPDNVFKYPSSLQRHFPEMFPRERGAGAAGQASAREELMNRLIELARNPHTTVDVGEARGLAQRRDVVFVDVRKPEQYRASHLPGAVNVPLETILKSRAGLPEERGTPIVTVCNRGNDSVSGMLALKSLGYANVRSMNGGTAAWVEQGYPVESGG